MSSIVSSSQRRRAYQCLKCLHRSDKTFIEARYRVYNHYLKEHVSLDAVPFYCKWCLFRAFKKEDLERHVDSYPRHKAVLREKGVHGEVEYLVENRAPYAISERDVAALSAAESQQHWQAASTKRGAFIAQAMEATYLDTTMGPQLGAEVAVPMTSPTPTPLMSALTQLPQSPPPFFPAMAAPSSPAAPVGQCVDWRALSPSVQTVVDVTQYLAPLQQLVGLLSTGQSSTATSQAAVVPPEPEPEVVPQMPVVPQLPAVPAASTPHPQPTPAETEVVEVMDSLPTREECQALAPKSGSPSCVTSSSSSSSSSSAHEDRAATRHKELLSAVKSLQATMSELRDSFVETCQSTQHMAKLVVNLAAVCAKQPAVVPMPLPSNTTSTAPGSVPLSQATFSQAPAALSYSSFPHPPTAAFFPPPPMSACVPPPFQPSYVPPPPAPKEREGPRSRDRSPLTERNPRQQSPRRERSRDSGKENRRRHRSPAHQRGSDRRIIKSRWR